MARDRKAMLSFDRTEDADGGSTFVCVQDGVRFETKLDHPGDLLMYYVDNIDDSGVLRAVVDVS